jgi:prepilin-type processing-associated H-X9-DG protein
MSDGLSNTMVVIEKQMVTGDATMTYKSWSILNRTGGNDGMNTWGTTDIPEQGIAYFGNTCNDPTSASDDNYGRNGRSNCRFGSDPFEYFHPPRPRLVPSQQHWGTIYPYHSGGAQTLMGDGSVRTVTTNVSIQAWSAAVTPAGGEATPLN